MIKLLLLTLLLPFLVKGQVVSEFDTICEGGTTILNYTGNLSTHWQPKEYISIIDNGVVAHPDKSVWIKATKKDSVFITVLNSPKVTISSKKIDNEIILKTKVEPYDEKNHYKYQWSPKYGTTSVINSFNLTVNPEYSTTYSVTVTDKYGCQGYDSMIIIKNKK